jgi:predicted amidohydrolase
LVPVVALALGLGAGQSDVHADPDTFVVAAINYTGWPLASDEAQCETDSDLALEACEVEWLVRQAALEGADLVVVSEYAFEVMETEVEPTVGQRPPAAALLQRRFAQIADELDLFLVIPVRTHAGSGLVSDHSSQIVFDPRGRVAAVHHKFELYESELDDFVPGGDVTTFMTPAGPVGLLLCSDLYGDPRLHERLVRDLGARIVAVSSMWTVEPAVQWQAAFAHDWDVVVVSANGAAGVGRGGGIFAPGGAALAMTDSGYDEVVLAILEP